MTDQPEDPADLHTVVRKIEEQRKAQERSLAEAEVQLQQIDERTQAAEQRLRVAQAKRLEELRAEENALQARLEEIQRNVAEAEERARETERRAIEAEEAVEVIGTPIIEAAPHRPPANPTTPATPSFSPATPAEPAAPSAVSPTLDPRTMTQSHRLPSASSDPALSEGVIDLNAVTVEQLRQRDLSVVQATRLLAYRERLGGFRSVEDLDQVEGLSYDTLADLKSRSTVSVRTPR